jgi:hypothetical protein
MSDAPTTPAHAGLPDGTDPTGTQPSGVRPDGDAPAALRAVAAHTVAGVPAGAPFVSALRARPGTIVLGDTPRRARAGRCASRSPRCGTRCG